MVKNLVLKDIEKVGMYFWYTDVKLDKGSFKGGNPTFSGFIIGLEFSQEKADIAFSFNYGMDFSKIDPMKYDHINPLLIYHLDQFKIKIIHTEKNLKVELYDENNALLSDSFRIHGPMIMNKETHKKHFGITTVYENVPNDIHLDLKNLKISTREETEKYDHRDLHTEHNQYPRTKADDEIRGAIADVNHFLNYLTVVLGTSKDNAIVQMAIEVKRKSRLMRETLDSMLVLAKESSQGDVNAIELDKVSKVNEFEHSLDEVLSKVEAYKLKLKEIDDKNKQVSSRATNIVLMIGMGFLIAAAIKIVTSKLISGVKTIKKVQ